MLIGAELYKDVVLSGRIGGPTGQPTPFETIFGLVLLYTREAIRETELEVFVFSNPNSISILVLKSSGNWKLSDLKFSCLRR